jgi:hypothetical protein
VTAATAGGASLRLGSLTQETYRPRMHFLYGVRATLRHDALDAQVAEAMHFPRTGFSTPYHYQACADLPPNSVSPYPPSSCFLGHYQAFPYFQPKVRLPYGYNYYSVVRLY